MEPSVAVTVAVSTRLPERLRGQGAEMESSSHPTLDTACKPDPAQRSTLPYNDVKAPDTSWCVTDQSLTSALVSFPDFLACSVLKLAFSPDEASEVLGHATIHLRLRKASVFEGKSGMVKRKACHAGCGLLPRLPQRKLLLGGAAFR